MAMKKRPKCDCWKHDFQVCDICQGVCSRCNGRGTINLVVSAGNHRTVPCDKCHGKNGLDKTETAPEFGYHTVKIAKGKIGYSSKIREELEELVDAENQNVKILVHCELADLYGALKAYALRVGLTMDDLKEMEALTHNAFKQGHR